jgi:hypothetical protein
MGLVAIGRPLLQTRDVLGSGLLADRVAVEEQELSRVEARQRSLGVGATDDQRHLGQAAAAAMPGAGENQPSDQLRVPRG